MKDTEPGAPDVSPQTVAAVMRNFQKPRFFKHNCYPATLDATGRKLFYVKLHKCASTSIIASLASRIYSDKGLPLPDGFPENVHSDKGEERAFHDLVSLSIEDILTHFHDPATFKFTVVRDPVRRIVSA